MKKVEAAYCTIENLFLSLYQQKETTIMEETRIPIGTEVITSGEFDDIFFGGRTGVVEGYKFSKYVIRMNTPRNHSAFCMSESDFRVKE